MTRLLEGWVLDLFDAGRIEAAFHGAGSTVVAAATVGWGTCEAQMCKNEKKNETEAVIEDAERAGREDEAGLSPLVQEEIGRRLRAIYGTLAQEPLPDRFAQLLQKLSEPDK